MRIAAHSATGSNTRIKLHFDGGAYHSIFNDLDLLMRYKNIKLYAINGVMKDEIV